MAASAVVVALCLLRAVANALSQMLGMWLGGTAYLQHLNLVRGDAFAIGGGAGPRLVFLSDPEAVRLFFTAPVTDIEFQPAAEYFMKRVFQLPNEGAEAVADRCAASWKPSLLCLNPAASQLRCTLLEQMRD